MRVHRPGSEAEIAEWVTSTLHRRSVDGAPVVTGLSLGRPPAGLDSLPRLGLSTTNLSSMLDFQPRDLMITVGAGMRLSTLARLVEEQGLWLPLAGMPEDRSVGGWIASAPAGEFDGSFGPLRRHVLACTLVLWDGRITRWGRPVMKNVAGYDVNKLVCGSRARLGILTSVTLRLWPGPREVSRFELSGEPLREAAPVLAEAPRLEGVVWRARPGLEQAGAASVVLAGGSASVSTRTRALHDWALDRGITIREESGKPINPCPPPEGRAQRSGSSAAYRITFGRRYLTAGLKELDRLLSSDGDSWRMEVFPATGVVRVLADERQAARRSQAPAWLTAVVEAPARGPGHRPTLEQPAVRVERGGLAEHEAARRMRSAGSRDVEKRWITAFAGVEAPWQSDYL